MDDRAATETLGTVLLLALVILLVTTIGLGLLAQTSAIEEDTERSYVNVQPKVNTTTVALTHAGGRSFPTSELIIVVEGDNGTVGPYRLDEPPVNGPGLPDGTFEVGDTLRVNHSFTGFVDISLYSPETDERLYRAVRSTTPPTPIPTPPAGPTANPQAPDKVAEGASITLDGSESVPNESIQTYNWSRKNESAPGTIIEDDPTTPNATYQAPADVSGNETVTIELNVTDDNRNSNTKTIEVTVIDIDTATAPTSGGEKCGFTDENNNGVYDEGEPLTCETDFSDGYNNPDGDLVIYPDVGDIQSSGGSLELTANTITAGNNLRASGDEIKLTAEGDINIDGATLTADGNAGINITSRNGNISAVGTTMTASAGPIELNSNGDINLESASLDGKSYTADLTTSTATLYVNQTTISGNGQNGGTLVYDPDGITVNGTPSEGTVSPT